MANASILAAFERMWQHVVTALGDKSDISHNHDDLYYTEAEIDNKIVDDLTTASADKVLSANQGVILQALIANLDETKVENVAGKGLSTNDYTTPEKTKLAGIAEGAEVNVQPDWSATSGDAQILNKPVLGSLAAKSTVAKSDLASDVQTSLGKADTALQSFTETDPTVPAWAKATSKPTYTADEVGALPDTMVIPSKTSQLTNDSGYLTSHQDISGKLDNTGDGSNVTTAFTVATSRTKLSTGEKLSASMGKIAKWFTDLGSLAFKSTVAKSDLDTAVQASLDKADSALQGFDETDPTVPDWAKADTKPTYVVGEIDGAVSYNTVQVLTEEQKEQARENIGTSDIIVRVW